MKAFKTEKAKDAYNEVYESFKVLDRADRGRLAARMISDMVNSEMGYEIDAFLEFWNNEHRTLQQRFTELVAKWLYILKEKDNGMYDARNAYSVGFAKGAFEGLKDFKFTPNCMDLGVPKNPYEFDFDSYGNDPVKFPYI